MTESADNTWIDEEPNTAVLYAEIMVEAVKNSRAIALQSELIWMLKLSGLIRPVDNINCSYNMFYYSDTIEYLWSRGGFFFFRIFRFNYRPVRDRTPVQKRGAGDVPRGISDQSGRGVWRVSPGHRGSSKAAEDRPTRVSLQVETVTRPSP